MKSLGEIIGGGFLVFGDGGGGFGCFWIVLCEFFIKCCDDVEGFVIVVDVWVEIVGFVYVVEVECLCVIFVLYGGLVLEIGYEEVVEGGGGEEWEVFYWEEGMGRRSGM